MKKADVDKMIKKAAVKDKKEDKKMMGNCLIKKKMKVKK